MRASELIVRALRKINVPGRGATLSGEAQAEALEALQDLLASNAVSRQFVPGIRRHFFALTDGKSIYSYGPGQDFDTDDFDDPAPIRIEGKPYIREGVSITENEVVVNGGFDTTSNWILGTGWSISGGKATIATGNASSSITQTPALVAGKTYVVKLDVTHRAGSVTLFVLDGSAVVNQVLSGSGTYEFEFAYSGGIASVSIQSDSGGTSDVDIDNVSILEKGLDKVSLPDSGGSDYPVRMVDQLTYNRKFSKGQGGRPYYGFYTLQETNGELRFDNAGVAGDIIIMDVLVNRVAVSSVNSTLRLQDFEIRWLTLALANEVAGEYGKSLRPDQMRNMRDAWTKLAAGTKRKNKLRVDGGLRRRQGFNIDRGDP